jgi:hypothetical protein
VKSPQDDRERLEFYVGVVEAESRHLAVTDARLFATAMTADRAADLDRDVQLAEQVDAFVVRFGRLQDTLADKLLPALLERTAERTGTVIDNLDRAEKLGWLPSVDEWMAVRKLRNRMIHDYVGHPAELASALAEAHAAVAMLIGVAEALTREVRQRFGSPRAS